MIVAFVWHLLETNPAGHLSVAHRDALRTAHQYLLTSQHRIQQVKSKGRLTRKPSARACPAYGARVTHGHSKERKSTYEINVYLGMAQRPDAYGSQSDAHSDRARAGAPPSQTALRP